MGNSATRKFKVGDRVRRVTPSEWPNKFGEVGKEYTVKGFNCGHVVIFDGCPGAGEQYFELVSPSLRIEEGKFYKTRDGRKVGPIKRWTDDEHPWMGDLDRPYRGSKTMFLFKVDGRNYEYTDLDIIDEWEEPAVAVAASNDNGTVKRNVPNVGDFVTKKSWHSGFYEVTSIDGKSLWIKVDGISDLRYDLKSDWIVRRSNTTPAIVALIENGQPKPSAVPHVHASEEAASKEAKRLAGVHKGQEFGVYVLTSTAKEAAPTYKHEWQRLAAKGEKVNAIKELRSLTGMTLKGAKDAVEHWLDVG